MMARLSLLLVVFVDLMSQGLVLPILSSLLISPDSKFLAASTSPGARELLFGLMTGVFYVCWFFGAAWISRISDYIGRKQGILICLVGAIGGFFLSIIAIIIHNYWLLLLGRAICGFTAGNQPIAQAALVDVSRNDAERTANMGLVVGASALGLVAGPLIAGLLSDPQIVGSIASCQLPFICGAGLIVVTLVLVLLFYQDTLTERRKIDFGLAEVFVNLWRIRERPTIVKLAVVFFFGEVGLNGFYIYLNDYGTTQFGFDTLQNSFSMIVFGVVMAVTSIVLVGPLTTRFRKIPVVAMSMALMAVSLVVYSVNGIPWLSWVLIVPVVFGFGLFYPTVLSLFSASGSPSEQGWVMGLTIALFTLGSGLISLAGGFLMTISPVLPFVTGVASFVVALVCAGWLWRQPDVQALDQPDPQACS